MTTCRKRIQKAPFSKRFASTLIRLAAVFKFIHSGERIQIYSFSWINLSGYVHISVDGRRIRREIDVLSNLPGLVWMGPELKKLFFFSIFQCELAQK